MQQRALQQLLRYAAQGLLALLLQALARPLVSDEARDEQSERADAFLLGRRTWDIWEPYWPLHDGGDPVSHGINVLPKYVASTTLKDLEWENSHLIEGDVPDGVAKLKEQPGQDLIMYGSHDLMHSLLEHDLIDEFRIWVHPVLLGKGRSFLKDGAERVNLDLVDTTVIPSGVAILTYQPVR